jgi:hypothetical protein
MNPKPFISLISLIFAPEEAKWVSTSCLVAIEIQGQQAQKTVKSPDKEEAIPEPDQPESLGNDVGSHNIGEEKHTVAWKVAQIKSR